MSEGSKAKKDDLRSPKVEGHFWDTDLDMKGQAVYDIYSSRCYHWHFDPRCQLQVKHLMSNTSIVFIKL